VRLDGLIAEATGRNGNRYQVTVLPDGDEDKGKWGKVSAEDWINFEDWNIPGECSGTCFSVGDIVSVAEGEGPVCWIGESKLFRGTCRVGVVIDGDMIFHSCGCTVKLLRRRGEDTPDQ
jgi:hypothetical protein